MTDPGAWNFRLAILPTGMTPRTELVRKTSSAVLRSARSISSSSTKMFEPSASSMIRPRKMPGTIGPVVGGVSSRSRRTRNRLALLASQTLPSAEEKRASSAPMLFACS